MKTHLIHLSVLLMILALGVLAFLYENGNHAGQLFIGIVTSVAYVGWGIAHHALSNNLHRKVVVEYMLIGILAIVMLLIVLSP